jgi:hypothetical protein
MANTDNRRTVLEIINEYLRTVPENEREAMEHSLKVGACWTLGWHTIDETAEYFPFHLEGMMVSPERARHVIEEAEHFRDMYK